MKNKLFAGVLCALCLCAPYANAQLSKNPDKFLGNITTGNSQMDVSGVPKYYQLWNQVTPENATKWGSVEGTRGSYSWWGADNASSYASEHNFPFKFHTLVWGSQYPSWFTSSLSVQERYNAIVKWMDAVKAHYPNLVMIDVVNEAVGMHQQGNPLMKESLGGGGRTGYDWLVKAFELAYERWPNAILIYNDYNTFQWDTDAYIELVRTLRDAGAPIDAYGCQSHDVDNISKSSLQTAMNKIQDAVKLPMYITELDINIESDEQQKAQYQNIFPMMWEAEYCAGVTLWGYIYGSTWVDHSGLYKNNSERPAMTWLKEYMATDAAKNAKSPFPGMKKQISLYIKPQTPLAPREDTLNITVRAQMVDKNKSIDSIKFYINDKLDTIMTVAPYIVKYVPKANGTYNLKAVVYANDGNTYERLGSFKATNPRYAFTDMSIPGTIEAENFDKGGEGVTFHDSNSTKDGDAKTYRTDEGGYDISNGNGGKVIGNTNSEEWLEYSVNVKEAGYYTYEAVVSSGSNGSGFTLAINGDEGITDITENISVPKTGSDWSKYITLTGRTTKQIKDGDRIIHLAITGSNCNIDKIIFKHLVINDSINIKINASASSISLGESNTLSFTPVNADKEDDIAYIKILMNGSLLTDTIKTRPLQFTYTPTDAGTNSISAIAVDKSGRESSIAKYSFKVRGPFKNITIPGTIQAENFDKGGEGLSYHDSNSNAEGDSNYRDDNGGVDLVKIGGTGTAIGYTNVGEWLEYTVDVQTAGYYAYEANVSSGTTGSAFRIGLMNNGKETILARINVPQTASNSWDTYKVVSDKISVNIPAGKQVIRFTITGANCNIDRVKFTLKADVPYITEDDKIANGTRYNLGGVRVNEYNNKGISIINGKKVLIIE